MLVEATARPESTFRLMTAAAAPVEANQNRGEAVRRALLAHPGTEALARWPLEGCEAAGVLICTGILGDANRRGWQALGPNLTHVHIEAQHGSLLGTGSGEYVAAALIEAARVHGHIPARCSAVG